MASKGIVIVGEQGLFGFAAPGRVDTLADKQGGRVLLHGDGTDTAGDDRAGDDAS